MYVVPETADVTGVLVNVGAWLSFVTSIVNDCPAEAVPSLTVSAITLGQALVQALGDKSGINRYGEALVPMDEALCRSVIDLSGRFYLVYEVQTRRQMIGNFSVELAEHFWRSFAETAKFNLHIDCLRGRNTHHILEGTFKASARALRQAVERNSRVIGVPSTKGSL